MYVTVLSVGSILLIPKRMIIKAIGGFFIIIIIGSVCATGLGLAGGAMTGTSVRDTVIYYALPTLCNGNGGGCVPINLIAERNG